MRFFNTAGPVNLEMHYSIPPLERLDVDDLLLLIRQWKYFVLHAPRQTGKTSTLLALRDRLNGGGEFRCAYVNVETGQSAREDVAEAMRAILGQMASEAEYVLNDPTLRRTSLDTLEAFGPHEALRGTLARWSESDSKPLVLLIDEIDALIGDTLLSVLRQLRAGYPDRPRRFPQSVILCGVRDVRDYRIRSAVENQIIAGGSAFNIKAKSLRLGDFSRREVDSLLGQHTEETGQAFTDEARREIWNLTQGQPWLVNALAYEACFDDKAGRDRSREITRDAIQDAREQLILRRETHLDQLTDKLQEERVRRVVEPLLSGARAAESIRPDDLQYVRDLGLVARDRPLRVVNPIYREVIPRDLTWTTQEMTIHHGPLRCGGGTPGDFRPHQGQAVGGEDLSPRRDGRQRAGDRVGDVSDVRRSLITFIIGAGPRRKHEFARWGCATRARCHRNSCLSEHFKRQPGATPVTVDREITVEGDHMWPSCPRRYS